MVAEFPAGELSCSCPNRTSFSPQCEGAKSASEKGPNFLELELELVALPVCSFNLRPNLIESLFVRD